MKTQLFILTALLGAIFLAPLSSAIAPTSDVLDAETACPTTTVEHIQCILEPYVGPWRDLVIDELTWYLGETMALIIEECKHVSSKCPMIRGYENDASFELLA